MHRDFVFSSFPSFQESYNHGQYRKLNGWPAPGSAIHLNMLGFTRLPNIYHSGLTPLMEQNWTRGYESIFIQEPLVGHWSIESRRKKREKKRTKRKWNMEAPKNLTQNNETSSTFQLSRINEFKNEITFFMNYLQQYYER